MALPTKDQISISIENIGNILDPKLTGFNTIDGVIGPECYSGGFCLVYPVTNGNDKYAFRVWHTEIEGIKERLKKISAYLGAHPLPYFVDFDYVDEALKVEDEEGNIQKIDAVRMQWVEGKNLVSYIDSVISDANLSESEKKQKILELATRFKTMVSELHKEGIAHGDLQHGNIIIAHDGSILLVDYDSVYVPTFTDEEQVTSGMAAYQHPCRKGKIYTASKYDDYFSELIIYLSLLCYAEDISLWQPIEERDEYSLLLTEADLADISQSALYKELCKIQNAEIQRLLQELEHNLAITDLGQVRPLENVLINSYEVQPEGKSLDENDILDLIGEVKPKARYKKTEVEVPYFDEDAAQSRYSQN
jgi:serine/threonine protein kinase